MRTEHGARYRWLAVGDRVCYVGRAGRPDLRGRIGRVVAVPPYRPPGAPKNAAVRWGRGQLVPCPRCNPDLAAELRLSGWWR